MDTLLKYIILNLLIFSHILFANTLSLTTNNQLSKQEKLYLQNKKVIKMCIDPNWMPFEKFDENGKYIGMSSDYFKLFHKNLGINVKVIKTKTWDETLKKAKNRECDIISLAMQTPKRKEYLDFTTPYLKVPLVIATKNNVSFVNSIESLENKKVVIPKGYAFVEILKKKYPNLQIIEVENIDEGLAKVDAGAVFGYIGTLATLGYEFQTTYNSNLKIAGRFDEKWELSIAVRNDDKILFDIMQKAVNSVKYHDSQKIFNNWIAIKYAPKVDYYLIIKILIGFIIIFLIILYFYFKQKHLKDTILEKKEKFEAIYNGSKDAIAILDMDSNFLEVNPAYIEMTGFTKDELLATSCLALTKTKDIKPSQKAMKEVLSIGYIKNFEKDCIVKNNKHITINMSISILHNPTRMLINIRDITEKKNKDKLLFQQSKLASMGEMIGNIAHQWRQPLSAISTSATGMLMQKEYGMLSDERFEKYCNAINDNAQYLSKTIDDFTNFIKGDRAKSIYSLTNNINSFLSLVDGAVKSKYIKIVLDLDDTIEIDGCQNELSQCMINIFNNAKDALVENNIENKIIFITTKIIKDKIMIEFKDNAGGIPNDVLSKIFEPYFTTKHQSQGTGLGLHMTYTLVVQGMDGNILAQNETYKYEDKEYTGAVFRISLPSSNK